MGTLLFAFERVNLTFNRVLRGDTVADSKSRNTGRKVELLFLALDPGKFSGLARALYDDRRDWPTGEFDRVQASLDHYYRNNGGTANPAIFVQLIDRWKFARDAKHLMLCSPADFVECMPSDLKAKVLSHPDASRILGEDALGPLRRKAGSKYRGLGRNTFGRDYHVIHVTRDYDKLDLIKALEDDAFDQKYLYLDRTAAVRWHNLTRGARKYSTFRNCKETLEDLVSSPEWKTVSSQIETALILGAGAAAKDDILVRSLAEDRKNAAVQYVVIDTSVHMILATLRELDELNKFDPPGNVELIGIVADFMQMDNVLRLLKREGCDIHREGGRAFFFLPGNTLANFNPERVFKTIYENSREGDLFLLSLETALPDGIEKFSAHLLGRYKDRELVELVLPPIRPFLDKHGIDVIGERAMGKITPKVVNSYWGDVNQINDEFTIEIRLVDELHGIDSLLARSSRYTEESIVNGARRLGFEPIGTPIRQSVQDLGYDHCQILLERQGSGRR